MFFTPFRWIKTKWRNLKTRWNDEWINYSVSSFDMTVERIGGISAITFIGTLILGGIILGVNALNPIPLGIVYIQAFYMGFGIPNAVLLFSLVGITKYLERWKRRNGYGATWWSERKASKCLHFFRRAILWTFIFYITFALIMMLGTFGAFLFNPAFFIYVLTMKLLIIDLFWIPICVIMPLMSWSMLVFTKFKYYMRRHELIRIEERTDRSSGSMPEYADEDDILDCRLERLGI